MSSRISSPREESSRVVLSHCRPGASDGLSQITSFSSSWNSAGCGRAKEGSKPRMEKSPFAARLSSAGASGPSSAWICFTSSAVCGAGGGTFCGTPSAPTGSKSIGRAARLARNTWLRVRAAPPVASSNSRRRATWSAASSSGSGGSAASSSSSARADFFAKVAAAEAEAAPPTEAAPCAVLDPSKVGLTARSRATTQCASALRPASLMLGLYSVLSSVARNGCVRASGEPSRSASAAPGGLATSAMR
mmetsp:Transcript_16497/g.52581  ORF Transcript_16497/g.52581 Transcript_16497/m.52581 type:complete len:248 (-) Transcript_16497:207-950(-)